MAPRRTGYIVVIGSHAAREAFTECGGYTAAKAGQLGLARVLAAEARPHDVRVTCVMPGATDTPIWNDRPDFDRSKMMQPADVASFITALVVRPEVSIDEVVVRPPAGIL
jgi:NAD(P)-dependent dehydrogenase (short-subunit alcohol dehydrogenase family)